MKKLLQSFEDVMAAWYSMWKYLGQSHNQQLNYSKSIFSSNLNYSDSDFTWRESLGQGTEKESTEKFLESYVYISVG